MPKLTAAEVAEIALLARLRLDREEIERMTLELDAILGYIDTVMKLDVGGAEPMTHAVPFDCPTREDETAPSLPAECVLANAPRREASFFQVPRIINPDRAGGGGEVG